MSRSLRAREAVVLATGVAVAGAAAVASGAPWRDTVSMVLMAAGASALVGVVGWLALRRLQRRRLVAQLLVVVVAVAAMTVAGSLLAAQAMFLSAHDLSVLLVVLSVSTAVAIAAGLELASLNQRNVADIEALVAELTDPSRSGPIDHVMPPGSSNEMHQLASLLVDAHGELDRARARQAALEASRRELVAWVSHDLRSPIASIRAMGEALVDDVVSDPVQVDRFHRAIVGETERLGTLVDDLFELARIESGAPSGDSALVPTNELVGEVVDAVQPNAAARGVNLVSMFDARGDSGGLVPGADLRRVLHNLLDNALRHTPPGGSVIVDGEVRAGQCTISVTDECGGIPAGDLPHVFDVAFRGDAARTRDARGGGLGLAIAKGLVESRHGDIEVANRGSGCRFTLRLPVVLP